ncbi:hypothetical protein ACFX1R_033877 [Malus domestica]
MLQTANPAIPSYWINGVTNSHKVKQEMLQTANPAIPSYWINGVTNSHKVKGEIVFCEAIGTGFGIVVADGAGAIMSDSFYTDSAFSCPLPATLITT